MRRSTVGGAALVVVLGLVLGGCTQPEPDPERAGTVVVAVGSAFGSLNAGTTLGRTPGSTLVRSLAQSGFVSVDEVGAAVFDESFGTVEKVADSPLTVRYTISPTALWSDGVPVTPDDLVLEWAARSGLYDDVTPEIDASGEVTNGDALDAGVAFAATSPALVHVPAVPIVEGTSVTLVYDVPVADWEVALDVNVPAHVLGATVLGIDDPAEAAAAVSAAILGEDKGALRSLSLAWRTGLTADLLAEDATAAVTTGPYVVDRVVGEERVDLVRNESYEGARPAAFDRVVLRTALHPLDQVTALRDDEVDVIAPTDTADVLDALEDVEDVTTRSGGDATLQLQLQVAGGGPFDPATYDGDAAKAAAVRKAFLATVPRDAVVSSVAEPLWADAAPADALLPAAGANVGEVEVAEADVADAERALADAGVPTPVVVRVLTDTADPVRLGVLDLVTEQAAEAGFAVRRYEQADGMVADLRGAPSAWDVALLPVPQSDLGAAATAARWRTQGSTNVTGWTSPETDAAVDALTAMVDPEARTDAFDAVAATLADGAAVLSLVRQPVVVATRDADPEDEGRLPQLEPVPPLALSRADLTSWWDWARTDA
ncbi:ABC transporter substrate-binding protein [Cellulomonas algicola]|uniref:ABC transporter substrate-binding protein n=1 Tax=Cellulomonas algicola TaxID=2071633 RepID=UPI001C3F537C|nr:ABC transporter substrate-binding protein [Cellulomonas algicola]